MFQQCPVCKITYDTKDGICPKCGFDPANDGAKGRGRVAAVRDSAPTVSPEIQSKLNAIGNRIDAKKFDEANLLISQAILSGIDDCMLYVLQAQVNLLTDNNAGLFANLYVLRRMEEQGGATGARTASCIRNLMGYRGMNGITPLHVATFHEKMEWVEFCTEHGSDVNLTAGSSSLTPIGMMFTSLGSSAKRLDGTPFQRDKIAVKTIRKYLMRQGAKDSFRFGY